ncbi:MAG: hypothetical protein P8X96_22130 [Desulfobacteraceae bacterium]
MNLEKFRNYLAAKGFVVESQTPYCLKWPKHFLHLKGLQAEMLADPLFFGRRDWI